MRILVDDVRNINGVDIIARTYDGAKVAIWGTTPHSVNPIDILYLDNDLGELDDDGTPSMYKDGQGILRWMFVNDLHPKQIILVTANIVARNNMISTLLDNGYVYDSKLKSFFFKGGD